VRSMLAVAAILLSLTYFCSCAASRGVDNRVDNDGDKRPESDSVEHFVPTHPPVVVPHPWRDSQ